MCLGNNRRLQIICPETHCAIIVTMKTTKNFFISLFYYFLIDNRTFRDNVQEVGATRKH